MRNSIAVVFFAVTALSALGVHAQESEIVLPETLFEVGVAELTDEGKLLLKRGAGSPVIPVTEMVMQTYEVQVPYTEKVEQDGKEVTVTRVRTETRTRTVPITRMVREPDATYSMTLLKFYQINGDEVSIDEAREHFAAKQVVVLLTGDATINSFYSQLFRDDVIIIRLPHSMPARRSSERRPVPPPRERR